MKAATIAVVMLIALVPATTAQASPDLPSAPSEPKILSGAETFEALGFSAEDLAMLRTQEDLQQFASQIQELAAIDVAGSGLSGLEIDPEGNELRLYWHGTMSDAVSHVVTSARDSGTVVTVAAAPYTRNELLDEIERISSLPLFDGNRSGQRTLTAAPRIDGTGIDVTLGGLPTGTTAATARQEVPALDSDIPMTVEVNAGIELAARWIDFPQYSGGAYIVRPGEGACSSAFGVAGNNGAAEYMLTAGHCGEGEWRTGSVRGSDGQTIQNTLGNVISSRATGHDGEAILTQEGSSPYVYIGDPVYPPNGDPGSNTVVGVDRVAESIPGSSHCASGSFTGTICDLHVEQTGITYVIDPPVNGVSTVTNMTNVVREGVSIAGNGDSGGPVFVPDFATGNLVALGVISAVDLSQEQPCTGWTPPGRRCSESMFYGEVTDIMDDIGVHINTV